MDFIQLKALCEFEKGSTGLAKAEPGNYPLVTTGAERKSCNTFQFDTKAVCIPLVSSTGHGHASLKNVHYQEGKFALGSILVALTSKDEDRMDIQFLHLYLSQLKDQVLVPLMSGAANVALSVKKIQNIEIPLPPIERQREIVERFKSIVIEEDELKTELAHQQILLKKLRQQILEDAIEGKLTTDWRAQHPDVEPANELLKRIDAEKAQLVKDKKIRVQKPLLPITNEEKSFELPQGWEWYRLKGIGLIVGGGTPSKSNEGYWGGEIPWVSPKDMKSEIINTTALKITQSGLSNSTANLIPKNSLLIVGRSGILKRTLPVCINAVECVVNQDMKVVIPYSPISSRFLQIMFWGMERHVLTNLVKYGMTVHSLKYSEFEDQLIPIPSLLEQQAIVTKVEELLSVCDQLDTQVTQNQTYAEQLMQAVLKEAFSHNSAETPVASQLQEAAHA